jgi:thiol-disulfide isomerase/thioredoxin
MKTFLTIASLAVIGIWFGFKKPEQGVPNLNDGKTVVQINYEWNKSNTYQWKAISGVKYYFLSLDKFPELKDKMKVKTVPTIIVLNNGQEVKRLEGGLLMKINNPQSDIIK